MPAKANQHNKIEKYFPILLSETPFTFGNVVADVFHFLLTGILFRYPVKFYQCVKGPITPIAGTA